MRAGWQVEFAWLCSMPGVKTRGNEVEVASASCTKPQTDRALPTAVVAHPITLGVCLLHAKGSACAHAEVGLSTSSQPCFRWREHGTVFGLRQVQ